MKNQSILKKFHLTENCFKIPENQLVVFTKQLIVCTSGFEKQC